MRKILNITALLVIMWLAAPALHAEEKDTPSVSVFGVPARSRMMGVLTDETTARIKNVFRDLGRFYPEPGYLLTGLMEKSGARETGEDIYMDTAKRAGSDIYVLFALYQLSDITYADLRVVAINPACKHLERAMVLGSRLMLNISLKIEREIIRLHSELPVRAEITGTPGDDLYLINAGQWHGLSGGMEGSSDENDIIIVETGRFQSVARANGGRVKDGDIFIFDIYPDSDEYLKEIESRISKNTVKKYSLENVLLKGDDPGKKLIESMCVVNIGGNLCLPGYASFLSTHYLGLKETSPSLAGVSVSALAILTQFCAPLVMNDFKINFFPWKKDSDKSGETQDLQIFLWSTLPVTYSVSYLDQLAYQFHEEQYLPPFFNDRDNAAAAFSLFLPGGGAFYKGYRITGWSFYFSEMIIASYGVYHYSDKEKRKTAFSALAVLKVADILFGYFAEPCYDFFLFEKGGEIDRTSLNLGYNYINDENTYNIMITRHF